MRRVQHATNKRNKILPIERYLNGHKNVRLLKNLFRLRRPRSLDLFPQRFNRCMWHGSSKSTMLIVNVICRFIKFINHVPYRQ